MKKETIEKLIDRLGVKFEELQNTLNAKSQLWLNNSIASVGSVDEWAWKQYASIDALKKQLNKINNHYYNEIKKQLVNTYYEELKAINGDFAKNLDEELEIPKEVQDKIDEFFKPFKKDSEILINEVTENHKKDISKVQMLASQRALKPAVGLEVKAKNTEVIYDAIVRATARGIQNQPTVTFSNGRKMNWKSYIEQQARTRLKMEADDYQVQAASDLGIIFWLLSSHFDCADDHAKYQGRIFVNRDWRSKVEDTELQNKIQSYIDSHNILFKEDVSEKGGLLKRPINYWNCRHYFEPISINQALNTKDEKSRDKLLKHLQMKGGEYDKKNYEDLQQQRYNERQIRKYKAQLEKDQLQLQSAPKGVDTTLIKKKIAHERMEVKRWQMAQQKLLQSNTLLWRDYRRESPSIVKTDLGARFKNMKTSS